MAVMMVPRSRGSFRQQCVELFAQLDCLLTRQATPLVPTTLTIFLREGADESVCRAILRAQFGDALPATTMIVQPPCCGAGLAVELWAVGGPGVELRHFGPHLLAVEAEGIRWFHCGGVRGNCARRGPYEESLTAFEQINGLLRGVGLSFEHVVRTWIYVNQITNGPEGRQRYQELNRARADFFQLHRRNPKHGAPTAPSQFFPASTGIGTSGANVTMSCLALDTRRQDVFVLPLENPQQTSACDYQAVYSPQAPRFSRAMAIVQGGLLSTLVSGTASIVQSKTCHVGDIARQTRQTLENIERLIAPENFSRHGLPGAGATLRDLAKVRVYVKRPQDYEQCRAMCERLLPGIPALYLQADVCRPDLLVEIEGVAFSSREGAGA